MNTPVNKIDKISMILVDVRDRSRGNLPTSIGSPWGVTSEETFGVQVGQFGNGCSWWTSTMMCFWTFPYLVSETLYQHLVELTELWHTTIFQVTVTWRKTCLITPYSKWRSSEPYFVYLLHIFVPFFVVLWPLKFVIHQIFTLIVLYCCGYWSSSLSFMIGM